MGQWVVWTADTQELALCLPQMWDAILMLQPPRSQRTGLPVAREPEHSLRRWCLEHHLEGEVLRKVQRSSRSARPSRCWEARRYVCRRLPVALPAHGGLLGL